MGSRRRRNIAGIVSIPVAVKRDAFDFEPLAQLPEKAGPAAVVHQADLREQWAGLWQLPQYSLKAFPNDEASGWQIAAIELLAVV